MKPYRTISSYRPDRNVANEPQNPNPTTLLISATEKSTLTGRTAKDEEHYPGALRDRDLWQVQHIMSWYLRQRHLGKARRLFRYYVSRTTALDNKLFFLP